MVKQSRMNKSPKQLAATPEASQNTRKHQFAPAQYSVVRLEPLDQLGNLRADAVATYQPVNSQELFAIEQIALAQQSLLRCAALEGGLHTLAMNMTVTAGGEPENLLSNDLIRDIEATRSQNRSLCLAVGFQRLTQKPDMWKLFLRQKQQAHRDYSLAIEEFERLKNLRPELPNEPIADENEPTTPEEILPQPPEISEEEAIRRHAAKTDPTVAITSPNPPSFNRRE
jgi:hypothetical protein